MKSLKRELSSLYGVKGLVARVGERETRDLANRVSLVVAKSKLAP